MSLFVCYAGRVQMTVQLCSFAMKDYDEVIAL